MCTIINDLNIPSTLMVLHALLLENIINADVCAGYVLNRALVIYVNGIPNVEDVCR